MAPVVALARLLHGEPIRQVVLTPLVEQRRHCDIGSDLVGMMRGIARAEHRAPRMREQNHLALVEPPAHQVDQLVEVALELRDGHRLRRDVVIERSTCTALIPVHDEKAPLEIGVVMPEQRGLARAGPAMEKDQRRVRPIDAAKPHALFDAADVGSLHRGDAARHRLAVRIDERWGR